MSIKKFEVIFLVLAFMGFFSTASGSEIWRLDSRYIFLDIAKVVKEEYKFTDEIATEISHFSGYYRISPFLLSELKVENKNLRVKSLAFDFYQSTLNNTYSLSKSMHTKIASIMHKYNIVENDKSATLENIPSFELPFNHDESWYFSATHNNYALPTRSLPLSAIDFELESYTYWGMDTTKDWLVATHDGVATVFSSCYFTITDESGWATSYYHLDNILVENGDYVQAGQRMANYADNREQALCDGGSSPNPHLHFALLKDGEYYPLDGVSFSGWKIHSGDFSFDGNKDRMWLEKNSIRKYVFHDTINHYEADDVIDYRFSGIFTAPEINGHGLNIIITQLVNEVTNEIRNVLFVTFYTYDDEGRANFYAGNIDFSVWKVGEVQNLRMIQTKGGNFSQLQAVNFEQDVENAGELSLKFNNCNEVEISMNLIERSSLSEVEHVLTLNKLVGTPDSVCKKQ